MKYTGNIFTDRYCFLIVGCDNCRFKKFYKKRKCSYSLIYSNITKVRGKMCITNFSSSYFKTGITL